MSAPVPTISKYSALKGYKKPKNLKTVLLKFFFTLPVTVAEAEWSFSWFSSIKDVLRSTTNLDRLKDFAGESDAIAVINISGSQKAKKLPL